MNLPCPRCGAEMTESETEDIWACPQCSYVSNNDDTGETPLP